MTLHKDLTLGNIHQIHDWEVADAAALAALTPTADDLGKVAWQQDDNSLWFLADETGPVWEQINGAAPAAVASVNGQTGTVVLDADDISDSGTTNKWTTAANLTKLAGIEALADVTDATNVDAAGAVMNSDTSTAAMSFVIDEDAMTSDSATKVPTQQSVKAYVDAQIGGVGTYTDEQARDAIGTALVAGNNIDITVSDGSDTITIDVESLTSADITDFAETVRDTMGTALVAGTGVTITPSDVGDTITIDATGGGGGSTLPIAGETSPHGSMTTTSSSASATKGQEVLAIANGTITGVSVEADRVSGRTYRFWLFALANETTGQLGAQVGSSADGVAAASGIGLVSVSGLSWSVTAGTRYALLVTDMSGTGTTALALRAQNTGGLDFWIGPGVPVASVGRTHRYDTTAPTAGNTSTAVASSGYYFSWTGTIASPGYTDEQAQDAVGGILTDSATVNFTYNDIANTITADVTLTGRLNIIIDGGGAAITTGVKVDIEVPYACTVTGWRLVADQSGSIVLDLWKDSYANYPPTVADTITGSEKPTLSSAVKAEDTSLTTWTTSLTKGDWIRVNVDSAGTVTRVTLSVLVTRTGA